MDLHSRSNTREYYERANVFGHPQPKQVVRASITEDKHGGYKLDRVSSKLSDSREKHRQQPLPGQLSGDDNYVRRWLVQTDEETNQKRTEHHVSRQRTPNRGQQHNAHATIAISYPAIKEDLTGALSRRKRKYNTSSDSSLLEPPVKQEQPPHRLSKHQNGNSAEEEVSPQPRKRQKTELADSEASTSSSVSSAPKKETFEKRARHKTREDRYESRKGKKKNSHGEDSKRPRRKREKKGDRKKAAKQAGEELIRNFSSKSIGQERLTIRPTQRVGLFKNGRASSPVRRRGIPDLAFSEMDFLQRSSKNMAALRDDNVFSKSREKEKRGAARAQEEISNFFKSNKPPLEPTRANRGSVVASDTKHRDSRDSNPKAPDYGPRTHERSHSFDIHKRHHIPFAEIRPASEILSASLERTIATSRPQNVPDSARLPGREMSYVSWSETQLSPSRSFSKVSRTVTTPTSDFIRRSLENTGIFRDTGISLADRHAVVYSHSDHSSPKRDKKRRTEPSGTSSNSPESRRIAPSDRLRRHGSSSRRSSHISEIQDDDELGDTKDRAIPVENGARKRERVIIEHFDPKVGWHEQLPDSGQVQEIMTLPAEKAQVPEKCKSAPLSREEREELAKLARIKRPSTTAPLTRTLPAGGETAGKGIQNTNVPTASVARAPNQPTLAGATVQVTAHERRDSLEVDLIDDAPLRQQIMMQGHGHIVNTQAASDLGIAREGGDHFSLLTGSAEPVLRESPSLERGTQTIHSNNPSFLGLPVRGSPPRRLLLQHSPQMIASKASDLEPSFLHQVLRQPALHEMSIYEDQLSFHGNEEPNHFPEIREVTEVEALAYNDVPQEEVNDFDVPRDNYFDDALQQDYEAFEDYRARPDDAESWQLRSSHIDMSLEQYEINRLGHESYYEHEMMEDHHNQQFLTGDYMAIEHDNGYEQYSHPRNNDTQVFWRPHNQY